MLLLMNVRRRQRPPEPIFYLFYRLPRRIKAGHEIRHVAQRPVMYPKRCTARGRAESPIVDDGMLDGSEETLGGVRRVT